MLNVFFQRTIENYYVIDINTNVCFVKSKYLIYFALNVIERNFKIHDNYVKMFIVSM